MEAMNYLAVAVQEEQSAKGKQHMQELQKLNKALTGKMKQAISTGRPTVQWKPQLKTLWLIALFGSMGSEQNLLADVASCVH